MEDLNLILEYLNHNNVRVKVYAPKNGYGPYGQKVMYDFGGPIDASTTIEDGAYFPSTGDEDFFSGVIRLNNTWYLYENMFEFYECGNTTLYYELREKLDEQIMREAVFYSGRENEYLQNL